MVPGAATVIIMVCVGFLVVMVILGVFRIRSIHRRGEGARGGAKEGSSQWDDSALTIIVNPMEVIKMFDFHSLSYVAKSVCSSAFTRVNFSEYSLQKKPIIIDVITLLHPLLFSPSPTSLVWASLPTRRARGRRMRR